MYIIGIRLIDLPTIIIYLVKPAPLPCFHLSPEEQAGR